MKTEWQRDYDHRFLKGLNIEDDEQMTDGLRLVRMRPVEKLQPIERPDPDYYERHSEGLDLAALAGALFCGIVFSWICYEVWAWLLGVK